MSLYPSLPDDSSSDEDAPPPPYRTTEEERQGSIPGSNRATAVALTHQSAQGNPVVPRGPPRRRRQGNPSVVLRPRQSSSSRTRPQNNQISGVCAIL